MTTKENRTIRTSLPADPTRSSESAHFRLRTGSAWRKLLAVLLGVHGFAHLVGTTDAVSAMRDNESLEYTFGWWELASNPALATAGVTWTLIAAAFAAVSMATWMHTPRWASGLRTVAAASFVLCLLALPQTFIGLIVNVALLAATSQVLPMQRG